jgi:thiaminase
MSSDELLAGLEQKWDKAVNHEFIKACIDGSVKPEQFNRWLVQVRRQIWANCCSGHLASAAAPAQQQDPDQHAARHQHIVHVCKTVYTTCIHSCCLSICQAAEARVGASQLPAAARAYCAERIAAVLARGLSFSHIRFPCLQICYMPSFNPC